MLRYEVVAQGYGYAKDDYAAFIRCLPATLDAFEVLEPERGEVVAFTTCWKREAEIVDA